MSSKRCGRGVGLVALLPLLLCLSTALAEPARALVYPAAVEAEDWRTKFPVLLLSRALARSGARYDLRPSAHTSPKARNFLNLANRRGIDVVWSMTSIERERDHLAVRIPINKGLMGHRLALIRASQPDLLAQIDNRQQLAQFSLGQLYAWTDTQILTHNGLTVVPGSSYDSLFRMLAAGRFDVFPRAATEVGDELARKGQLGLVLDRHLLIHYPAAMYYFVHREDAALAAAIERGLEIMLDSGEFDALFLQNFGPLIEALELSKRRVILLDNPLLPADTPLCRRALWWRDMCPPPRAASH